MSDNGNLARVKIFRFDPKTDRKPRYETFNVPYEGLSVLNILKSIYHDLDAELAFRWGCEGAGDCRCGACVIMVNGRPCLACRKTAEPEMVIEPHPKFEIVRDLVIDFNKISKGLSKRDTSVKITINTEKCIKCGDCVSICPVAVYKAEEGEIVPSDIKFCCGDSCFQCVTYCQEKAISIELL